MTAFKAVSSLVLVCAAVMGCVEKEKEPQSAAGKRAAQSDVLGSVLPAMLASEYVAKICDGYDYESSLAAVDMDIAWRVMSREAYSREEFDSASAELVALKTEALNKNIDAGAYAPAERYCPTLESAEGQQSLLALRYLKKVR